MNADTESSQSSESCDSDEIPVESSLKNYNDTIAIARLKTARQNNLW